MVSSSYDGSLIFWNTSSWQINKLVKNHSKAILKVCLLANNDLITGSEDKSIKVWDVKNYSVKRTLTLHNDSVYVLFSLPDDEFLSATMRDKSILWDINTYVQIKSINSFITMIAILHNGDLAVSIYNSSIYIYDKTLSSVKKMLTNHTGLIIKLLTLSNGDLASCSTDGNVIIWDTINFKIKTVIKIGFVVNNILQFRSEYLIISYGDEGHFKIVNLNGLTVYEQTYYHSKRISTLMLLNSETLLTGSFDSLIKVSKLSLS